MMKYLASLLFSISIVLVNPIAARSDDYGTRDEAVAMVARVVEFYRANGLDATKSALSDADNKTFHDRDLYPFIYDLNGICVAHGVNPKLIGKNLIRLEDQKGLRVVYQFTEVAKSPGSGWVTYHWVNPVTTLIEKKESYIVRLDETLLVGVGIYIHE